MRINGVEMTLSELSLSTLIESQGYQCQRVVVEVNGLIVKQNAYDSFWLNGDEVIEIVRFVGGG